MNSSMTRGIILFGHGSRDPLWRQPMEAVAAHVQALEPAVEVACAYLELSEPDLATAATRLMATGAREITVVPMFLGVGKHARHDLPVLLDELRETYPSVRWVLQPAIGENSQVIDLLARVALGTAA